MFNKELCSNLVIASVAAVCVGGCSLFPHADAPPPPPAGYEPNYKFPVTPNGSKLDVTVGVARPQFGEDGKKYFALYRGDETVRGMLNAMSASFNEILAAKGFNTKGPFESRELMTYPDKQGSDFLLYPNLDTEISVRFTNVRQAAPPSRGVSGISFGSKKEEKAAPAAPDPSSAVCDAVLTMIGSVSIVVQEPVTGEVMDRKKIDIGMPKKTIVGQQGAMCVQADATTDIWTMDLKNAWAHAHEDVFQTSMKAFNDYVNGTEMQSFKRQSVDLRNRKTY